MKWKICQKNYLFFSLKFKSFEFFQTSILIGLSLHWKDHASDK